MAWGGLSRVHRGGAGRLVGLSGDSRAAEPGSQPEMGGRGGTSVGGASAPSGTGRWGTGRRLRNSDSPVEWLLITTHLSNTEVKETVGKQDSEHGSGLHQALLSWEKFSKCIPQAADQVHTLSWLFLQSDPYARDPTGLEKLTPPHQWWTLGKWEQSQGVCIVQCCGIQPKIIALFSLHITYLSRTEL